MGLAVLPRMTPKVFAEGPAALPAAGADGQLIRLSERLESLSARSIHASPNIEFDQKAVNG